MMKRLTSILLVLLMLVGMALAEETPDPILGDWYTADGLICFTFRADGTFTYVIDGTWSKSEDGEYLLTYDDNTQDLLNLLDGTVDGEIPEADMTARLTTDGLVITCFGAPEGTEIYLLRDAVDFQTERTPRTDTPLEAFAGTWTMETMFLGSMQLTYTPEMGERQVFCTIDGLTLLPGAGLDAYPEGTSFPLTFEDGVLRTTIPMTVQMASSSAVVQEIAVDYDLTFFQTADGSLYATLRLSSEPNNPETVFLLIPMD